MLIDTPAKMAARQAEFDQENINGLKRMKNKQMAQIIVEAKYGEDTDYINGLDAGEGPKGS